MNEFILSLIKYATIFTCMTYAYIKLLRIKPNAWDLLDLPAVFALTFVLSLIAVFVKLLVPLGFLLLGSAFLFLRFRKPIYVTVTVSAIALGISIVLYLFSFLVATLLTMSFHLVNNEYIQKTIGVVFDAVLQITGVLLLFRIKRLRSGLNPETKNATFDILLYLSIACIFTMMMLYAEEIKQYMLKVAILFISLFGLLLITWWRRHISYNYRDGADKKKLEELEQAVHEHELQATQNDFEVKAFSKLFHYLNKAIPDCAVLVESAAAQTGCNDACAAGDILSRVLQEMNLTNRKCSLQGIPQTGVREIDMPILSLFTAAEQTRLKVSTDISKDAINRFYDAGIDKNDLHTILTYLCDNARIAALELPDAKVRLVLASHNRYPVIRVYDSGKQFDENVLTRLGIEQNTSREGGCGWGLFTVFGLLDKYMASFTLDEEPQVLGFSKFIEIAFDGQHSFTVRTCRNSVALACTSRKNFNVILYDSDVLRDGTNG